MEGGVFLVGVGGWCLRQRFRVRLLAKYQRHTRRVSTQQQNTTDSSALANEWDLRSLRKQTTTASMLGQVAKFEWFCQLSSTVSSRVSSCTTEQSGSRDRPLHAPFPSLGLDARDHLVEACGIQDVADFEHLSNLLCCVLFWRLRMESSARRRNPLFDASLGSRQHEA